jgi:hypothetical protein
MASSQLVRRKVASLGLGLVEPTQGLAALERLLTAPAGNAGRAALLPAVLPVVPFAWDRFFARRVQVGCVCVLTWEVLRLAQRAVAQRSAADTFKYTHTP